MDGPPRGRPWGCAGSRTISTSGTIRGSAAWWANDDFYFEHNNFYRIVIAFKMYRYLSPDIKVLLDTSYVEAGCAESGSTIYLIRNDAD